MKKKILIAPLNWGLGHATRCIPIIHALLKEDVDVLLASDGRAYELLRQEFPDLPLFQLPAYNITYSTNNMIFNIAVQLPKIAWAILREQIAIRRLVREQQIDAIISDNRFGCFHFGITTAFMTHQINLKIPFRPLEVLACWGNRFWIRLFDVCWIPDIEGEPNLAGELSHAISLKKITYLGILSRMQYYEQPKRYDAIAVISGPEPQRTHFEKAILAQVRLLPEKKILVVGGKPEQQGHQQADNVEYVAFLATEALNDAMLASEVVISRSGYSTLMDLAHLRKAAILIPTPGQTEQEYLAEHFMEQGIFYAQAQKDFDLNTALESVKAYTAWQTPTKDTLAIILRNWLQEL